MIRSFVAQRRNFNRLWFAQSISLAGLQVGSVAIPLLAVDVLHASASQVALIGTWSTAPWLVLAPVIGTLADRLDRKRLLVVSHLGRALLWLTIPATYLIGGLTIVQVWLISMLVGILGIVFEVGYHSFLPNIVPPEELGTANGKLAGTDAVSRSAGPALAGYLIHLINAPLTLVVQTAASVVAGVSTAGIHIVPQTKPAARPATTSSRSDRLRAWRADIGAGFSCLWRIRPLRWLTIAEAGYLFFFNAAFAVLVVFLRSGLGLTATSIGIVYSAGSIAGLLGATVASRLSIWFGRNATLRTAAILRGTGLALLPLCLFAPAGTEILVLIAARALNAAAWSVCEVLANSYQQGTLPDRHRGSATAAGLWLGRGAEALGATTAAAASATINTTMLIIAAGLGATAAGLLTLLADLRSIEPAQAVRDHPVR